MSDSHPHKVVGSRAFTDLERTKAGLIVRLRLRIEADKLQHPAGDVLNEFPCVGEANCVLGDKALYPVHSLVQRRLTAAAAR